MEELNFILGKTSTDYLQVAVYAYTYPESYDSWDGNWLNTAIKIKTEAVITDFKAQLRTTDLEVLSKVFEYLHKNLDGSISFCSFENDLQFSINSNGLSNYVAKGIAENEEGHSLSFSLTFHHSEIKTILRSLATIRKGFPTKG